SDGLTVVATARDESRFHSRLGGPRDVRRWRGFGLLPVPAFTDDGLRQMLIAVAARARVTLNAEHAIGLIEDSDRKPETLIINGDLARRSGMALTESTWRPTEGESWGQRFASARADDSAVDRVCQVLQLLHECCVAARVAYVKSIARAEGAADVDS